MPSTRAATRNITVPAVSPEFDPAVLAFALGAALGQIDVCRADDARVIVRGDLSAASFLRTTAAVQLSEAAEAIELLLDVLRDDLGVTPQGSGQ